MRPSSASSGGPASAPPARCTLSAGKSVGATRRCGRAWPASSGGGRPSPRCCGRTSAPLGTR
eukprot:7340256-Lingulodinium_polyedra.AAC.1